MSSLEKEFLEQIEQHKGVIFKISKMYMDNFDDQKDLFQEIIFQIWKAFPNFERRSKFSTWMYRIALNTAIVFLKSEKKRSFITNYDIQNVQISTLEYDKQEEENLAKMYTAIQKLNEIDKALIFYYLEDFSGREIAENLGISEVNARVKLNRAKEKLKQLI